MNTTGCVSLVNDENDDALDVEFRCILQKIKPYIKNITNQYQIEQYRKWLDKLNQTKSYEKFLRNQYLHELSQQIRDNTIRLPFIQNPPAGDLTPIDNKDTILYKTTTNKTLNGDNTDNESNSWCDLTISDTAIDNPTRIKNDCVLSPKKQILNEEHQHFIETLKLEISFYKDENQQLHAIIDEQLKRIQQLERQLGTTVKQEEFVQNELLTNLRTCIERMDRLIVKTEREYRKRIGELQQELDFKEVASEMKLQTQKSELLVNFNISKQDEINEAINNLEKKYKLLLIAQKNNTKM